MIASPEATVDRARKILKGQADALTHISDVLAEDEDIRLEFWDALNYIYQKLTKDEGKIILTGVGKSYKIASKIASSMNSLGVPASAVHTQDALHGDMGVLRQSDVVIMISASGNTPELKTLWRHICTKVGTIVLTCTPGGPLSSMASKVLPAYVPEHLKEKALYGLEAPTVTSTACLAVGDALTITLAEALTADKEKLRQKFTQHHPGGSIGVINNNNEEDGGGKNIATYSRFSGKIDYLDLDEDEQLNPFGGDRVKVFEFIRDKQYILFNKTWLIDIVDFLTIFDSQGTLTNEQVEAKGQLVANVKFVENNNDEGLLPKDWFIVWDPKKEKFTSVYNDPNLKQRF